MDAPGLSNTIRLWGEMLSCWGRSNKACMLCLGLNLLPAMSMTMNYLAGFFCSLSGSYQIILNQTCKAASFFPKNHFKKHYRTLVSRGMPLNKHIKWKKQSPCHMLTNTRWDRNAKNLLIGIEPSREQRMVDVARFSFTTGWPIAFNGMTSN